MRIKEKHVRTGGVIVTAVALAFPLLSPTSAQAETGSQIIERAQSWTSAGVGYSAGGMFSNEYGTYRTDCSGFASMALGLPTSYTTGTLTGVSYPIAKDALEPGDMLLNPAEGTSGHVTIFGGWADTTQTRYFAYEQSPSGGAHVSEMPYPYWPGYGTFAPRRYVETVSTSPTVPPVPKPPRPRPVAAPEDPLRDGDFVRHDGNVYRLAGGAPIRVSSWRDVGGRQESRRLTDDEFAELAVRPADGSVLRTPKPPRGRNETYVVAGGAPVILPQGSDGKAVLVEQKVVDEAGENPLIPLNDQPADGTVVGTDRGGHYVFAGGAPVMMTRDWWRSMRPRPAGLEVSQAALDQAGGLNGWSHVRFVPADGTLVKAGAAVYRFEGGLPVSDTGVRGVPIDPAALAIASETGTWTRSGTGHWSQG